MVKGHAYLKMPLPVSMNLVSQSTIQKIFFRKESVLHKVAPYQFVNIYVSNH